MWLTSSSIGRKFIMALTGACLVLFVTFHCVMNAIAIVWPASYNVICEFLGANWYALIASAGLAILFIIHIIYACWLTLQNRKARGNDRYLVSKPAPGVEWSSKNMLVLGIVVLAFLVIHLIQFWARMQLEEIRGVEGMIPPQAGTLFIQEAFGNWWTLPVYLIGFAALWFHMNHGFWSMFQTIGWDNKIWIPRLKKIGCWWTSIVMGLFALQGIVFTYNASNDFYKTEPALQMQYVGMVMAEYGEEAPQNVEFGDFAKSINNSWEQLQNMTDNDINMQSQYNPQFLEIVKMVERMHGLVVYLQGETQQIYPASAGIEPQPVNQTQKQN